MKIKVSMTEDEFSEFMAWRKDKTASERALQEVGRELEKLAGMVIKTLEECGETDEPEYRIGSQEDAAKLVAAATDAFE